MAHCKTYYDLSRMTEDDIIDMMESVPTDDEETGSEDGAEDFDSDDDIADPDYVFIETELPTDQQINTTQNCTEANRMILNRNDDEACSANSSLQAQTPIESYISTSSATINLSTRHPNTSRFKKCPQETELQHEEDVPTGPSCGAFNGHISEVKNDSPEFKSIIWKKKKLQLHLNEIIFHGQKELPTELLVLKTPYDCFRYFLTSDFLRYLADQMNLYARQTNIETRFITEESELLKFIGILIFMSVYRFPNVRAYWGRHSMEAVRQSMTRHRFEETRRRLHFNDNSAAISKDQPGYDRLYKIRPLIKHFNGRFVSIPMRQRLCVDEQMCATKMRGNPTRQYMPAKPHKWGTKIFSLCDSSGYSYAFEIYSGAGDNVISENIPDLGAASNVVVRLSKDIPDNINHIVYFDNFYTSLGLLVYLRSRGIYSLGTVRANRVPNIKLSSELELAKNKVERGYSEEYVGTAYGLDITNVLWRDTKTVRLLSTYVGTKPFLSRQLEQSPQKAIRWDRINKKNIEIDCPAIIKEYNQHMGGVDLMDSLIGRYRIRMKTRKWTNRIFFHLLDLTMVNAYVLYHRLPGNTKKQLPDFRTEVAEALCVMGTVQPAKRGRPSFSESPPPAKPKKSYMPVDNFRYDQIGHWCIFLDRSGKKMCKMTNCKSETQSFCKKCNLNLCNSTTKNCFFEFHNR